MAKHNNAKKVWGEVTDADFENETNIVDEDIGEFNTESMVIFGANLTYARQLVSIIDCLTPVQRRILYAFYKEGALPGKKTKCASLVTTAMKYHNHGDISVYATMVGMTQEWKTPVPYISGPSNFGSANNQKGYGAYRYTEAFMSKYAQECFFSDYNEKAIGMVSFVTGVEEPKFLPSKFPNILVNGTAGIAWGHLGVICPYHVEDIIHLCKTYMKNPNAEDIVVYPDFPTGCNIVENHDEIASITKNGTGKIRMRAKIDIKETDTDYRLIIRNVPYTVDFSGVITRIKDLGASKALTLKHVGELSETYENPDGTTWVDPVLEVRIDKALDPVKVRSTLYKLTELDKTLSVDLKCIIGATDLKRFSVKELVLAWLEQRRLFKRSLYNHKLLKLRSDIDTKKIMIELTEKDNLEKTIKIVRKTRIDELPYALMNEYGMSSHQAKVIANMHLGAYTADAHDKYVAELEKLQKQLRDVEEIAYSPKKIDKVIMKELEDLRKYGTPERQSQVIQLSDEVEINNSQHLLVITQNGYIKKLPEVPDRYHTKNPVGVLQQGDQPIRRIIANNLDSILLVDDQGYYTMMPVYEIPNTIYSSIGETVFNVTKLSGKIKASIDFDEEDFVNSQLLQPPVTDYEEHLVILTEQGMLKATPLSTYIFKDEKGESAEPAKKYNAKAMKVKEGDTIATVGLIPIGAKIDTRVLIYTAKGKYSLFDVSEINTTQMKDTMGLRYLIPEENDKCAGVALVYDEFEFMDNVFDGDKYVVIVTAKGYVKKVEVEYMQEAGKRRDASYLIKVDDDDSVIFVDGMRDVDMLEFYTKANGVQTLLPDDIPTLSRMAKGKKMIGVPLGDSITGIAVAHGENRGRKKDK